MDEKQAAALWAEKRGVAPITIKRFPTGSCNYVFKVSDQSGDHVLRVADPANRSVLAGSVYWLERLRDLRLPIPRIEFSGLNADPPWVALNHIPGQDLGALIAGLGEGEKQAIAEAVVELQRKLGSLPEGPGFGFLHSYEDPTALPSWEAVIHRHIERSRGRLRANGIFEAGLADQVEALVPAFSGYFSGIRPRPFFDDATTKNVLVHRGKFSGLVDLDWLCFGDSLLTPALTAMSLRDSGNSLSYVDYWLAARGIDGPQTKAFNFYVLLFCLDFMSEKGMRFNKSHISLVDQTEKQRMERQFEFLYQAVQAQGA